MSIEQRSCRFNGAFIFLFNYRYENTGPINKCVPTLLQTYGHMLLFLSAPEPRNTIQIKAINATVVVIVFFLNTYTSQ